MTQSTAHIHVNKTNTRKATNVQPYDSLSEYNACAMWVGVFSGQTAWLLIPLLLGLVLGLVVPGSDFIEDKVLRTVSSVIGWQYFLCWTVSFYPQVILNHQRKSVQGLSIDFQVLNFIGFASYSVYNCSLYWSHGIRQAYMDKYGHPPSIHINDVAFSLNAFVLCCISLVQCCCYGGRLWDTVSKSTRVFCLTSGILAAACPILLCFHVINVGLTWMTFVYLLSYLKLSTTMVKYIPQIILNYRRQSTIGFSCSQVVLDLQGGLLSLTQQCMDVLVMGHWSFITGNLAKLGLGLASICFDAILMIQHWILYPLQSEDENEELDTALLA